MVLGTHFFETASFRCAPHSSGLCWTGGLRHEFVLWKRLRADNQFFFGEPDKHKLRRKQHTELGGNRSEERCHHTGDIQVRIGKRYDEHEPDRDDHLHADSNQYRGLGDVYTNRYGRHVRQTNNQLFRC